MKYSKNRYLNIYLIHVWKNERIRIGITGNYNLITLYLTINASVKLLFN